MLIITFPKRLLHVFKQYVWRRYKTTMSTLLILLLEPNEFFLVIKRQRMKNTIYFIDPPTMYVYSVFKAYNRKRIMQRSMKVRWLIIYKAIILSILNNRIYSHIEKDLIFGPCIQGGFNDARWKTISSVGSLRKWQIVALVWFYNFLSIIRRVIFRYKIDVSLKQNFRVKKTAQIVFYKKYRGKFVF